MNFNWTDLDNTLDVVEQLRNTGSTKEKGNILKANVNDETLQKVLTYTYDSFSKYGISEEVYNDIPICSHATIYQTPYEMFNELASSNINDILREKAKYFIEVITPEQYRELIKGILFKDLKLGVNAKSINKVWKGLIPTFDVQLAESFSKKQPKENEYFYLTTKLDGFRILAVPNEQGAYDFFTRKGEQYEGLDHLQSDCQRIGQGIFVLDGELIARNDDNLTSGELYKVTSKIARKKGKTAEKARLEFHVFDIVEVNEFKQGRGGATYHQRRFLLDGLFKDCKQELVNLKKVEVLYQGSDQSMIPTITKELEEQGYEGTMINIGSAKYECKRHSGVLKVKSFKSGEFYVKSLFEGNGRLLNKLGGITIQYLYNGELHECDLGSGFSDKERLEYWNNKDLLIGKVVECQFFEVSENAEGGVGLRFPVWLGRIRDDKGFEDITDVALI